MSQYEVTAGHILAGYVWSRIQTEILWTADDYGGLVPIVPVQQQPELNSATGPFIVFASAIDYYSPLWIINHETVSFTIFSEGTRDINEVTNIIVSKFKKFDESAKAVNDYIATLGAAYNEYKNFDFKTIRVTGASGAQPSLQEGGRQDGNVVVKCSYTYYGNR